MERQHRRRIFPLQRTDLHHRRPRRHISQATDTGNFNLLFAATIMMAATVVTTNRLVWRRLYALAETRYKLES